MYDLIDVLENELSKYEIIEILNEVLDNYIENKEQLNSYAIENRICPKCLTELEIHKWKEDRGEYMGSLALEEMNELYCGRCGTSYPIER
jgi:uncharacterized protein YbaR (Trm112 family)